MLQQLPRYFGLPRYYGGSPSKIICSASQAARSWSASVRVARSAGRAWHELSGDLEQPLDLDCGVERQDGDADRGAGVPALVAEHLDHQVGGAVHHLRPVEEGGVRVDESTKPHDPHDLVEIAERDLDLSQEVDGAGAGGLLTVLDRHGFPKLALGDERAAGSEADLAGDDQHRSGAHKADIIGDRRGRCREHDTEICELLFNQGHVASFVLASGPLVATTRQCLGRSTVHIQVREPRRPSVAAAAVHPYVRPTGAARRIPMTMRNHLRLMSAMIAAAVLL